MRHSISDTAEWGDYRSGPRVIDEGVRERMRQVLSEIQDGSFAKEWIGEADQGFPHFLALRREARASQIEQVGAGLRRMMPWLNSEDKVAPDA
jgi:ketol-acid reductoisomerase